jgi:hypothetical protein
MVLIDEKIHWIESYINIGVDGNSADFFVLCHFDSRNAIDFDSMAPMSRDVFVDDGENQKWVSAPCPCDVAMKQENILGRCFI